MPVKVWVFYCPVVITKQFFTTECNICTSHKVNTIALQSAGKLHNGKLPYLINSPGGKVILELVKGFIAFVGILQRISNSIFTVYCPELHRWHAPITNSSLFAQRVQRAKRIVMEEWRHTIHYVYAFPIPDPYDALLSMLVAAYAPVVKLRFLRVRVARSVLPC